MHGTAARPGWLRWLRALASASGARGLLPWQGLAALTVSAARSRWYVTSFAIFSSLRGTSRPSSGTSSTAEGDAQ